MNNMPKWLQNFFFVLGAAFWIFVALKGCAWLAEEEAAPPKNDPAELCEGLRRGDIVELRYTTHLHATEANAMMHVIVPHMGTDEDLRIWVESLLEMEKAGTALHVEEGTQLEVLRVHKHDTKVDLVRYTVEVAGSRGTWWIAGSMLKKPEQ